MKIKFPSPYGVSFILILRNVFNLIYEAGFRLLTEYHSFLYTREFIQPSKFSFRLLTEYHSFLLTMKSGNVIELKGDIVSVSLRSIIHSYLFQVLLMFLYLLRFRLLTEYHSFLLKGDILTITSNVISFRLLTEYHSFLYKVLYSYDTIICITKFPSPYGVSFILILKVWYHCKCQG